MFSSASALSRLASNTSRLLSFECEENLCEITGIPLRWCADVSVVREVTLQRVALSRRELMPKYFPYLENFRDLLAFMDENLVAIVGRQAVSTSTQGH